ncbi:MAG: nitrogen fixation protein NifQ [Methylocystis sp.]
MNTHVVPLSVDKAQQFGLCVDDSVPVPRPAKIYQKLTGVAPEAVDIESDEAFDRHAFACITSVAACEAGELTERIGVSAEDLGELLSSYTLGDMVARENCAVAAEAANPEEVELIRDILLAHVVPGSEKGRWFASMIARRALEPNHLWEDLGLRNRSELTRLMGRHFASLAARNDKNMRWKRFIYRLMCENDGFVMCATPVCTNCADYNSCFGPEEGISRLSELSASSEPGV